MTELDKGDQKVEGAVKDLILKVATAAASDFVVKDEEAKG